MKILARLAPREVAGADHVLDGMLAEVASGNQCRVWPTETRDPVLKPGLPAPVLSAYDLMDGDNERDSARCAR